MTTGTIAPEIPRTPWGLLPPRMRVLYVCTRGRTGGWLADALAADTASDVVLDEVNRISTGLERLRDEPFDAVLMGHEPGELDALRMAGGVRAANPDLPIVVLGAQSEQELAAQCYEVGADAYVCVNTATTRALLWSMSRAIEYHRLTAENRRLSQLQKQRLTQEQDEVQQLLSQQRALTFGLQAIRARSDPLPSASGRGAGGDSDPPADECTGRAPIRLPERLVDHYRDLLRAHVIMGSGNLSDEMNKLADLLATAGVTAQQTMELHLRALDELVRGLGTRSARHVMNRADLLVLDVMIHLIEEYRRRFLERKNPPEQRRLPGFA